MKTLKQLREESDVKFLDQVKKNDTLMFEGRTSAVKTASQTRSIPLPSEMPPMLLFKRVAYRMYPDKQVVALYYSKTVDKYLSVPFGPDGNLNLSESVIHQTEGATWDAIKGGAKGVVQGALKGAAVGSVVTHLPGIAAGATIGGTVGAYKGAKKALDKQKPNVAENFSSKLSTIRQQKLDENPIVRAIGGWALDKVVDYFSGGKGKDKEKEKESATTKTSSDYIREKPGMKGRSSWKQAGSADAAYQAKLKSATQKEIEASKQAKSVSENKISDIRKFVSEGSDTYDLSINGRSVTLNTSMAKRILEVYDSVNSKNKKIVETMLNEDLESFKKLINFSIKA